MSEHTPVTGELREAVEWEPTFCGPDKAMVPQPEFDRICDAIDAVHAQLERDYKVACERVAELDKRDDSMHIGWVRLPVAADGEPIHIGDVMENIVCPSVHREVTGVGAECFYGWDDGNGRYSQFDVSCYRHHHEPTVEDVLTEFVSEFNRDDTELCDEEIIERFAAKLRLAGDAE